MSEETEAQLVKKMIAALRRLPDTYAVKIHGDMYQERGIPDIVGCRKGKFFAIEVKRPGKEKNLSPYQKLKLRHFHKAKGLAFVSTSVEDVVKQVKKLK